MRVTEQGAASNAVELGASGIRGMAHPRLTRANAFGAKGLASAARAVVQGRSDGPTRTKCEPRSHLCVFLLKII